MNKSSEIGPLLSFIAEGVMLFNEKGHITYVNPHAALLLDIFGKELIGRHIDKVIKIYLDNKIISPKDIISRYVIKQNKTFNAPAGHTIYFKSSNRGRFPVFISAKTFKIKNNKIGILVFRDITTEKELEKYKQNTTKKLSRLTPILQEIATGNFSTKITLPKTEDEFTELLVGLQLMIDDLYELEKARKRSERKNIEEVKREEELKRELTEKYSKDLEKKVKEKTKELKQINIHIETIIENLTSGLIEYNNDLTLIRINKAAEDLLGVKRKKIMGWKITPKDIKIKSLKSLVEVTYPALCEGAIKYDKKISGVDNDIHELKIKNEFERELNVTTVPILSHYTKKRIGVLKIIRDITREKIISKSKSEFISIAAHQLRTPLSAIKWALRLLIDGDEGPMTAAQIELLNKGYQTNEKMIQLVNDLLNVARIEEGRFGYEFKENDIIKVLSSVITSTNIVAKRKNINLIFNNSKIKIIPFVFDDKKIGLVIQKLVDNAIKYTLDGGKVTVDINKKGGFIEIKVSDTGVGIPKNQIGRMFTKFYRGENVMRIQTSGSGLGLFITKNIVERHGGKISLESRENKGSVFTFTLPLNKKLIPKENKIYYE